MAHLAVFSYYPYNKAAEVAAVYTKLQQNRSALLAKSTGPYMWVTPHGVETFQAWEVQNSKLYDATIRLYAAMSQYSGIEGYRYDVRTVATASEGEDMRAALAQMQARNRKQ